MTVPTVLEFDVPERRPDTTPRLEFKIGKDRYAMVMPKLSATAGILALIQDDDLDIRKHGARLATAMFGLIDFIEPQPPEPAFIPNPDWSEGDPEYEREMPNPTAGRPRGQALLRKRLMDPEDGMDIEHLSPIFKACVQVLYKRPTGPSPASSQPQASDGSGSEAVMPDRQGETS